MDFTPDETQRTAAQLAEDVLSRTAGDPARAWRALSDTGLLSLGVPEPAGGHGLGLCEVAAVLREVGRAGMSLPAWATLGMGLPTLAACPDGGSDSRSDRDGNGREDHGLTALLRAVGAGEALLTAALHEPSSPMTERPATTAAPVPSGWRLDGVKTAVPFATDAERILVPATLPGGETGVFLVDPTRPGVRMTPVHTAAGGPEAVVRLEGAETPLRLGGVSGERAGAMLNMLHRYALAGAAAFGDGLLAGALALTTRHLATREQFGRPLATFQAVAQQIADVYIASRTVRLAADAAVWRLATAPSSPPGADRAPGTAEPAGPAGPAVDDDLAVAAYWLAEEAPAALATCHHLHGGIGLDETYPLHRYSSLVKDLVRGIGGAALCLDRVGTPVGGV